MLDRIVAAKQEEVALLAPRLSAIRAAAEAAPARSSLAAALAGSTGMAVIAEVKRRSPSAGEIRAASAPDTAGTYAAAGAHGISVLTDGPYFGGALADLEAVAAAVETPLLRKDFTIHEVQVWQARAAGASAVLLIARILDDAQLRAYGQLAGTLGMDALVEVHDERETERALRADARLIGVNNRDLATFTTDLSLTARLGALVPRDRLLVGESGVRTVDDVRQLADAGASAVLVGEALMRAGDAGALLRAFSAVPKRR